MKFNTYTIDEKYIKKYNPATIYWSAFPKRGKWPVTYLCSMGNDFVSFYDFSIGFWKCS